MRIVRGWRRAVHHGAAIGRVCADRSSHRTRSGGQRGRGRGAQRLMMEQADKRAHEEEEGEEPVHSCRA